MSKFVSGLSPMIEAMLDYREALGFSRQTHMSSLMSFDRYCAKHDPDAITLNKSTVHAWIYHELEKPRVDIQVKASAVRALGKYIAAIGMVAYELPTDFVSQKKVFSPYIFTDSELTCLFNAIDHLPFDNIDHINVIAPVLFRLIYSCGLRPNEGRMLEYSNVNLSTGEILVTKTKRKKERLVVMSDDMLSLCKCYAEHRQAFAADSGFFFPCADGKAFNSNRLDRIFKRCWEAANPDVEPKQLPNIRIYDLRHRHVSTILNRWLDAKRDLYA